MKKIISVTGLDCAHCAAKFEKIVKECDGIESASMNFMLEKMIVYNKQKMLFVFRDGSEIIVDM